MSAPVNHQQEHLLIFDFDNTLVDDNTDTYPFKILAPDLLKSHFFNKQLRKTTPWTQLVNDCLKILSDRSIPPSEILSTVSETVFPEANIQLIKSIRKSTTARTAIVSDANEHFIEACLAANELSREDFEAGIYTNSSIIDGSIIKITPFTTTHGEHDCSKCPSNICKTAVLSHLISSYPHSKVTYIGDGSNDYCPASALPPESLVLARKGFALERCVLADPIRASTLVWADAEELFGIVGEHIPELR